MKQSNYVIIFIARPANGGPEFLMACREQGKYMGGTWQLISGGIELNEIAWHAALREMNEETGLRPIELYRLSRTNTFYRSDNDSLCTAIPFLAIVPADAEVWLNDENTDFCWINRREVSARLMWPDDRAAFDDACRQILDNSPAKPHLAIPLIPNP